MTAPDGDRRTFVADAAYTFHRRRADRLPRAIVVRGDRIERLLDPDGRDARRELAGTQVHDLSGSVLVPGFFDAHNHQPSAARDVYEVRTAGARSLPELLDVLAAAAGRTHVGEWITTEHALTLSQLGTRALPLATELDTAAPYHPVAVRFGAHTMALNSLALRRIGMDGRVPDPQGGVVDREAGTGQPLGPIREYGAIRLVLDRLATPGPQRLVDALRTVQRQYAAAGLTSVRVPGLRPADLGLYEDLLRADGRLANRMFGGPRLDPVASQREKLATIDAWPRPAAFDGGGWIGLHSVKVFVDGGVETALGGRTHLFLEPDELAGLVRSAGAHGWPVSCHAVTPTAIDMVLDVYEAIDRVGVALPPTIEHGFLATEGQLERAGRLGVWLSTQPGIADVEAALVRDSLCDADLDRSFPLSTALRLGVPCAIGSDWNATPGSDERPYGPLRSIRAATRGVRADGGGPRAAERVGVETAFYLHTRAPALLVGRDDLGGLWPGSRADLVALDADPVEDIEAAAVTASFVGGARTA